MEQIRVLFVLILSNEPCFNGFTIKDGEYVIIPDEHVNTGTHWNVTDVKSSLARCFGSFCFEHFPEEIKNSWAIETLLEIF